jgi:phosphoribosylglycinamide formyltransferase-1
LAGYLKKIPNELIDIFKSKIINIHPSLLPKYGGKGMYGDNVHKQVLLNKEKETGITIHFVNEKYDKGEIIFQKK